MIYLHDGHIREIGIDWARLVGIIQEVVRISAEGDCAHPLKPYLRFRDPANRIIAMPAYIGGGINLSGIKWIASFPNNGRLGLPRAHNSIILNDPATGVPVAFIQSNMLNGLRTAAVSGAMTQAYMASRPISKVRAGIIGWGPIGRMHLDMLISLLGDRLERVALYDMNPIDPGTVPASVREITELADDWQSVYAASDIFATCTVSAERYIDAPPPEGALLLNVSLRDYLPESVAHVRAVVVDDWREICRENTDIEQLHIQHGLLESDVLTLEDVLCRGGLSSVAANEPVFFNPMGLGVFDIGVAGHFVQEAVRLGKGVVLENGNGDG
ncbi:ornithine cyclodeaminase [Paenibacillus swuensis]|uniref:Ornithine cyclodeaminase n=1 Tax=Paenibacillus swuensis TaxID=1178515 RepID=A0A172THL0_9BACL|nr:2,3-diaminopropionate biosynthesis protein SbnB [Paenibacillus swuensis]ANE46500.1 ornithine cyclodeaminase [Paenibacillus swuensis]